MRDARPNRAGSTPAFFLVAAMLLAGSFLSPAVSAAADDKVRVMQMLPRFRLTNQAGGKFGSKELDGKVWIATFIFTRCPATCPLQTAELAKLQDRIGDRFEKDGIHFVSISVDPEHDSPEVLAKYAAGVGADPSRWTHLTGERDKIWDLSKDGFRLPVFDAKDDPSTIIAHSQNFVLVDRARRVRGSYDGLDEKSRGKLLADLERVLDDPPAPIVVAKEVPDDDGPGPRLYQPKELRETAWMAEREEAQRAAARDYDVFHGFRFTDRQPESGITFRNRVVEDAARLYKGVHYDHGNGVSVADVDGDGLLDIYFVNQVGSNQLCRNLGGGRFEDITDKAGVGVPGKIGVTASFADIDNDDDPDLYVTNVRDGNVLFENDGKGRFTDISKESGLDYRGHSSSAVFFDYDRDGLLDLFLTNVGRYTTDQTGAAGYYVGFADAFAGQLKPERLEASILFRNLGKRRFANVSKETGLVDRGWTGAAAPLDRNGDGWTDLYVLSMQGHDEYWENEGGKRFVNKSREVFPATSWGAMGIQVFDFDNDGLMDIYVTDMHTDMIDDFGRLRRLWYAEKLKMQDMFPKRFLTTDGNHVLGNAFFHNRGNGEYREVSDQIGAENYWPWGLSTGDLNADGFTDAFVTSSMNYPFRYGVNSLLLNEKGERFRDAEFVVGIEPRRDGRTSQLWFTVDCDGADKEHFHCEGRTGKFEVWGALGSRSSVLFDLDGDGDLDIVTNEFHAEPLVLVSDLSDRNPDIRWLRVDLEGTESNRDGLGARVEVKAGGQTYTRIHDGQSGYLSQSVAPLYFGLGGASKVDSITVTWPSGRTQSLEGPIETNRLLEIREG